MNSKKNEGMRDFDTSDSPLEPAQRPAKRPPPIPVRPKAAPGPARPLPGANDVTYMRSQKKEATPFGGQNRRAKSPTTQFSVRPDTPIKPASHVQAMAQAANPASTPKPAQTAPGEDSWDVYVDGENGKPGGVYKVPASSEDEAKERAEEWLNGGGDPELAGRRFDRTKFQAVRGESAGSTYEQVLRHAVRTMVREVVRKKEGGGGYVLYGPNKGKKKQAKPAGEFPTRLAAKRAELARFPPKDPEQLKKARKRMDKLLKDPKKRSDAEKKDLSGRKTTKKAGKAAGARKKSVREALIQRLAGDLMERLFHEDEIPGSPWDEKIASLTPDVIASDKALSKHHKNIQQASSWALGDAHKAMAKALRGIARINPGDTAHDPERKKTFIPVMMDVDGIEIGPVHLYIDGGHVKIEISQDARSQISELEPDMARDLRGGLMSFQEDHLPEISWARDAWGDRDKYLDKLHGKLEKHATGLSGVEHHLMKQLLGKSRKK